MPKPNTDAETALQKLGQRLRQGHAKQHPVSDQSLETVRGAVREQWEQEQQAEREKKPAPNVAKDRQRKPPEPDQER